MSLLKICGLYRPEDMEIANQTRPDYVGFVLFVEKSHRNITTSPLKEFSGMLHPCIQKVGVFVNPTCEQLLEVAEYLDVIQLHGWETVEDLQKFQDLLSKEFPEKNHQFWKAFTVKTAEDVQKALDFPTSLVLLDYGKGEGKSFDWNLLTDIQKPYILAGGITPENVGEAVQRFQPHMIDVSSGVETRKTKDIQKIRKLQEEIEKYSSKK